MYQALAKEQRNSLLKQRRKAAASTLNDLLEGNIYFGFCLTKDSLTTQSVNSFFRPEMCQAKVK